MAYSSKGDGCAEAGDTGADDAYLKALLGLCFEHCEWLWTCAQEWKDEIGTGKVKLGRLVRGTSKELISGTYNLRRNLSYPS